MEGFDSIGGNFQIVQPWLAKYATWNAELGKYHISASWQMGLSEATSVGCLLGVIIGAWQVDYFGYRWSLIGNLLTLSGFLGVQVFAVNIKMLLVGNLLTGRE
jgi:SP family general alpha glucoside:H+ symporter-like MFS transporter